MPTPGSIERVGCTTVCDRTVATIHKDIRELERADLDGFDAIVHMAELSNDPAGALSPTITYEINHQASVRLARLAKAAGIERFVYMSSCSVYGVAERRRHRGFACRIRRPPTANARFSSSAIFSTLRDDDFSPTFLRNATAFGASPRMRFDIVLNNLAGLAWTTGEIAMTSDGTPWRPLVTCARHRQGDRVRARSTPGVGARRGVQRGRHGSELPGARHRGDRRQGLRRMRA